MSTKTLRKRIALVAAAALGAGLLTVVSVPSASADVTNTSESVRDNATSGVAISTESIGLLGATGSGLAQTAVLLATGALSTSFIGTTVTASVTGGRFVAVSNTDIGDPLADPVTSITGTATITGTSSTSAALVAHVAGESGEINLLAVPNSGATSMVVSYYANGVISARITTTIAATSAYNKYSATYSYAYWGATDAEDVTTYTTTSDVASANSAKATGGVLFGQIAIADAYGNPVTTGILTATVTAGAYVNLDTTEANSLAASAVAGTTTVDYNSVTGVPIYFNVQQDDVDVPWNGTVTIAFNGTVVATKSGILTGEVASVTVTSPKIGAKSPAANLEAARVTFADASGNALYPASGLTAVSTTLGTIVTGLTYATPPTSTSAGKISMACGAGTLGAVTGLQMQFLNTSGTIVKSNTWASGCSDAPYTVEASWDRVSYVPGSIATLTLKFKDSKGNLSNAYDPIGQNNSTPVVMTVAGGPSVAAITPIAGTDTPSGVTGIKTYQYVVGSVEGDFVAVIVPTEIKENNSSATNISLPYSVKAATTGVSNADVLKAIVSLIASINKQIAALQKALLKKK